MNRNAVVNINTTRLADCDRLCKLLRVDEGGDAVAPDDVKVHLGRVSQMAQIS